MVKGKKFPFFTVMTLSPAPNCSSEPFLSPLENLNHKENEIKVESQEILDDLTQQQQFPHSFSPRKQRTKSPGVRIRGNRVFDSENGKTCHQCRQKTMDFGASCKSQSDDKLCKIKICHKCLFNRYGEKAEEANELNDWKCPKCRGICNCSFCMMKRGHQPTGRLARAAKASGFRSVLDMLTANGPETISVFRDNVMSSEGRKITLEDNAFGGRKDDGAQSKKRSKEAHLRVDVGEKTTKIRLNKLKILARAKEQECKSSIKISTGETKFEGRKDDGRKAQLTSEISVNVTEDEDEMISERVDGGEKKPKPRQRNLKILARAKTQ